MPSSPASIPLYRPAPLAGARRGLYWYLVSLRLWRRSVFKLMLLAIVPLLLEGLIQLIPVAGMLLSKVVVPLFGAGVLIGVNHLARTGRISWRCIVAGFAPRLLPGLVVLSLVGLVVVATQVGVALLVYGPGVIDAVVWGHIHAHPGLVSPAFTEVLILPGLVTGTLLTLAAPLFLFEGVPPLAAVVQSIRRVGAAWPAFAVALAVQLVLMAVALSNPFGILLMLVLMPWSTAVGYVAYREAVGRPLELSGKASVPGVTAET